MTPAEARKAGEELARRTRKAQGLRPKIEDRETIRKVVSWLVPGKAS